MVSVNGISAEETIVSAHSTPRSFIASKDPAKATEIRINSKKLRGLFLLLVCSLIMFIPVQNADISYSYITEGRTIRMNIT